MKTVLLSCAVSLCMLLAPTGASAMTSHDGWPEINGMLLMNKLDQDRPLDGRPGKDPFDGQDSTYSCDGLHENSACVRGGSGHVFGPRGQECDTTRDEQVYVDEGDVDADSADEPMARTSRSRGRCKSSGSHNRVPANIGHNELLGGHGDDTIHAGPRGDVIWGDYKEDSPQPKSQRDRLFGGRGGDHIYASHGKNVIKAGAGNDWIKAHFGHGTIDCGAGNDTLYLSGPARGHYTVRNCETVSKRTMGY